MPDLQSARSDLLIRDGVFEAHVRARSDSDWEKTIGEQR